MPSPEVSDLLASISKSCEEARQAVQSLQSAVERLSDENEPHQGVARPLSLYLDELEDIFNRR